jgi:hypothetical protein
VLRPHPPESLEDMWRRDQHGPPVQERSLDLDGKDRSLVEGPSDLPTLPSIRPGSPHLQLPSNVYHGEEELR